VFRVAGSVVAAWMGAGAQGKLAGPGLAVTGRLAVRVSESGKTDTVVAH
jgi:hypothetical protein